MCTRWQCSLVSDFYIYEALDCSVVCQISLCATLGKATYIRFLMCSVTDARNVLLTVGRNTHSLKKTPQWHLGSASRVWMQNFSGLEKYCKDCAISRFRRLGTSEKKKMWWRTPADGGVMKDTCWWGDPSSNHGAWTAEEFDDTLRLSVRAAP